MIQQMFAIWSLGPLPFLKPSWTSGSSWFMYCWKPGLENFKHYFTSVWDECNCAVVWTFLDIFFLWEWNENWPFPVLWQGKLEVIKEDMTRLNIDILGISELKWSGMGEFNSDDHYIYYCGLESLRKIGVSLMVNKRVWNAVLGCNLINDRMISVSFQGKSFNITVI